MRGTKIVNGYINNCWIEREEEKSDIKITCELVLSCGKALMDLPYGELRQLFDVLMINKLEDIKGKPCVALVTKGCVRTIGNFLYGKYDFDTEKYWLYYENWEKPIDKIIKEEEVLSQRLEEE